jgi:hypothetical protein
MLTSFMSGKGAEVKGAQMDEVKINHLGKYRTNRSDETYSELRLTIPRLNKLRM